VVAVSTVCAGVVHLTPLEPPVGYDGGRWADEDPATWRSVEGISEPEAVALDFAEQFSADVSSTTADQRGSLFRCFGHRAADLAATVFVMDFLPRTRAALEALFGARGAADPMAPVAGPDTAAARPGSDTGAGPGLWDALDAFTRVVPRLEGLDAVTTELVRLRGARQHQCRLCASLRSRPALLAGADEQTFDSVDAYGDSGLAPADKAALALTDAMVWAPSAIGGDTIGDLVDSTSPAQRVELVLDITRNALNKVAVALGADAPHVEDGIEIFDIDAGGDLIYGLRLD
jgi:AhpD family alkylhydroperoxidase